MRPVWGSYSQIPLPVASSARDSLSSLFLMLSFSLRCRTLYSSETASSRASTASTTVEATSSVRKRSMKAAGLLTRMLPSGSAASGMPKRLSWSASNMGLLWPSVMMGMLSTLSPRRMRSAWRAAASPCWKPPDIMPPTIPLPSRPSQMEYRGASRAREISRMLESSGSGWPC